jgi:hypothetical protein
MTRSHIFAVEVTEGAIRVRRGARVLTITPTPPPPDAGDAPDFIIHLDDIETWDAPANEVERSRWLSCILFCAPSRRNANATGFPSNSNDAAAAFAA